MDNKRTDWHPADIIAGLRKRGTSLAAESRKAGLNSATLANALTRPWPKGEQIIAKALETQPWEIWPSRYFDPVTNAFIDRSLLMRKK
ncbi:DNA-binding transcriptional regulator SfsB [Enterobacteriaceae bacterium H20N1]|uniref:Sugar fermentation stimulation protein B n=1 Tax=Dryocola boscaweniae TaxID=2925397 RepID=A0A9X3APB3_9ENTR|nr:DNA-binding transcriptional regulator SfsB [Dryocola boscaweniae]MCT4703116.1 DNA-binding transcriptional regulator SfsB [Dryocola boscaweniae]MCT4720284.1 DNA-binding transcriptional regulator SfsB [Dryocola boscaweniae]